MMLTPMCIIVIVVVIIAVIKVSLQCFDAVGWVTGRAPGL